MMWMVESSSNEDEERRLKNMGTEYGRKLRPLMPRPMMKMMMLPNSSSSSSCSCIKNPNPLPLVSTRWNPTPEQLQALEDMYRRGVRTPSAEQIQHIASKLRRFGKIEGKNVFYWFQNHKARERQKKRRHLINHTLQSSPGTGTGLSSSSRRSYIEIGDDQPSPCEDSASMQDGAVITPHLRQDEWTQLQLQLHHKDLDLHLQKKKKISNAKNEDQTSSSSNNNKAAPVLQDHNQTLHLFPIVASTSTSTDSIPHDAPSTIQTKFTPNQFIEFLPTKN